MPNHYFTSSPNRTFNTGPTQDPKPKAEPTLYWAKDLMDAIREVETGPPPKTGIGVKGDKGKALGPYQIHKGYFKDASPGLANYGWPLDYERCLNDKDYSENVLHAYFRRYCSVTHSDKQRGGKGIGHPISGPWYRLLTGKGTIADCEEVSRKHNGGPDGNWRNTTKPYWKKVKKVLKSSVGK